MLQVSLIVNLCQLLNQNSEPRVWAEEVLGICCLLEFEFCRALGLGCRARVWGFRAEGLGV